MTDNKTASQAKSASQTNSANVAPKPAGIAAIKGTQFAKPAPQQQAQQGGASSAGQGRPKTGSEGQTQGQPRKTALVVSSSSCLDYLYLELPDFMFIIRQLLYIDGVPYRDVIEYKYEDFLRWMQENPDKTPKTSGTDSNDIAELVIQLIENEYTEVLFLTQGKSMSTTHDTVQEITTILAGRLQVEIFDTGTFGASELPFIFMAARMIKEGKSMRAIVNTLHLIREHTDMYIVPNDLRYMISQGRMGKFKGAVTNLLDVKPVLRIRLGMVTVHDKVRKADRSLEYLANMINDICEHEDAFYVSMYSNDTEFRKKILRLINQDHVRLSVHITPGLLCHFGPDTLAVTFFKQHSKYLPPDFEFKF